MRKSGSKDNKNMETIIMDLGIKAEIFYANLPESNGSIQKGYRPVLIVSNAQNNTYSPVVNVYPFTSRMSKKDIPVHVKFYAGEYGLPKDSILLMEQPLSIQKIAIGEKIGEINDIEKLSEIAFKGSIQMPIFKLLMYYRK